MLRRIDDGREAVLARVDDPYTQVMTARGPVTAYLSDGATGWSGQGIWGPVACVLGPLDEAAALLGAVRDKGWVDDLVWYHLPPGMPLAFPAAFGFEWEFKWTVGPPAPHPLGDQVVALGEADAAEVDRLLDASLPDSSVRPGSALVRGWYGIRRPDGRTLVACAADQSGGGLGFIGGVAVDPPDQGGGLGTAVTLGLAARLHAEFGRVALAVMGDNPRAIALWDRIGFAATVRRTTVRVADG